jgi:hypothetical protein
MSHTFYPADQTEIMRTALDLWREIKGEQSPAKITKRAWELAGFVGGLTLGDPDVSGSCPCKDDACGLCDDAECCKELEEIAVELGVKTAGNVDYFVSVALGPQKAKVKMPWLKDVAAALIKLAIQYLPDLLPLFVAPPDTIPAQSSAPSGGELAAKAKAEKGKH